MIYFKAPKYIVKHLWNWWIKLIENFSVTCWWFLENSGVKPVVQTTLGGEPRICSILLPVSLVSTHIPFANHENCITKPTIRIQPEKNWGGRHKTSTILDIIYEAHVHVRIWMLDLAIF